MREVDRYVTPVTARTLQETVIFDAGPESCEWDYPERGIPPLRVDVAHLGLKLRYIIGPEHGHDPELPRPGRVKGRHWRQRVFQEIPLTPIVNRTPVAPAPPEYQEYVKQSYAIRCMVNRGKWINGAQIKYRVFEWPVWKIGGYEHDYSRTNDARN
jgi:hypothetical protein